MQNVSLNKLDLENYDVVGFDLDGTLYPERDFVAQAYEAIASHFFSQSIDSKQLAYDFLFQRWLEKGSSYPHIFSEAYKQFQSSLSLNEEEFIRKCLLLYRGFKPKLILSKALEEVFDWLQNKKAFMFLVTDGSSDLQRAKFTALSLSRFFTEDRVVFTGDQGKDYYKPNVLAYQKLNIPKDLKTIYCGDRDVDKIFADNITCDFLQVKWSD